MVQHSNRSLGPYDLMRYHTPVPPGVPVMHKVPVLYLAIALDSRPFALGNTQFSNTSTLVMPYEAAHGTHKINTQSVLPHP